MISIQTCLAALETVQGGGGRRDGGERGRGGGHSNESYWYTHRRAHIPYHISATCHNSADGYIAIATLHNRQGENNRFCGGNKG